MPDAVADQQRDAATLDDEIVQGRIKWLKAVWASDLKRADKARKDVDALLDERLALAAAAS